MAKSIISLVLLIISVGFSFKHGWDTLNYKKHPGSLKMMNELGISEAMTPFIGVLTILTAVLQIIPETFVFGNLLSAVSIVTIMALALKAGNARIALMEIPFLAMPLILIWLKYPFLKS